MLEKENALFARNKMLIPKHPILLKWEDSDWNKGIVSFNKKSNGSSWWGIVRNLGIA